MENEGSVVLRVIALDADLCLKMKRIAFTQGLSVPLLVRRVLEQSRFEFAENGILAMSPVSFPKPLCERLDERAKEFARAAAERTPAPEAEVPVERYESVNDEAISVVILLPRSLDSRLCLTARSLGKKAPELIKDILRMNFVGNNNYHPVPGVV